MTNHATATAEQSIIDAADRQTAKGRGAFLVTAYGYVDGFTGARHLEATDG